MDWVFIVLQNPASSAIIVHSNGERIRYLFASDKKFSCHPLSGPPWCTHHAFIPLQWEDFICMCVWETAELRVNSKSEQIDFWKWIVNCLSRNGVGLNEVSCLDNCREVRRVALPRAAPEGQAHVESQTNGEPPNELADKQIAQRERERARLRRGPKQCNLVTLKLLFDCSNDLQFLIAGSSDCVQRWRADREEAGIVGFLR